MRVPNRNATHPYRATLTVNTSSVRCGAVVSGDKDARDPPCVSELVCWLHPGTRQGCQHGRLSDCAWRKRAAVLVCAPAGPRAPLPSSSAGSEPRNVRSAAAHHPSSAVRGRCAPAPAPYAAESIQRSTLPCSCSSTASMLGRSSATGSGYRSMSHRWLAVCRLCALRRERTLVSTSILMGERETDREREGATGRECESPKGVWVAVGRGRRDA